MNYLNIALVWTAYCALHSFLISIRFTNWVKPILNNGYAYYRLFYVIISIILILPVFHYTDKLASEVIITYDSPWSVIRYILMYGALLMFAKAFFFDYDFLSFFGIRQILNFKKTSSASGDNIIKKSGLLGLVRHPMYLAVIVYLWSQTFRVSDIVANSVLTIYVFIGTILEEKKLVAEFGDSYVQYQKEVPMLIPFTKFK
ncbi:MAG: isoprenylcysteine carboxylmethyltransferase family protein [Bacteroidales bacterium]|nr:isoprenylcysteine carboxylmethyltransferase family protein [Bacteroidales bacterium]